jgi:hypothetical protein
MFKNAKTPILLGALAAAVGCGSGDEPANNSTVQQNINCEGDVCRVSGTLTEDVTFTKDKQWVLRGGVFVGNDVDRTILTVEPGTKIFGESASLSFLVVTRGSQLIADGTKDEPIIFTSSKTPGSRARGDWGGLIINGRAPINSCASGVCEAEGEGGTGTYGGDDASDNSGTLRYVRVEFAGSLISPDNELNGIGFQGVGSGTTVDYVQVHMNKDDGVEFFGGTVNFKHVLTTGIGDDNLDWTDGWRGKGQFFLAKQYDDNGDNGIEADNNSDDNAREPRSMPTLSNITILGVPNGAGSDVGVLLREGTGVDLSNLVVTGFNEGCLDIDNEETFTAGELKIDNSVVYCSALNSAAFDFISDEEDFTPPFTVEEFFMTMNTGNVVTNPMIDGFMPSVGSPLLAGGAAPSDSFFDDVDFIGAMGDEDWTAGWTTEEPN